MSTLDDIRAMAIRHANAEGGAVPRLRVFSADAPTELTPFVCDAAVCLVLQGAKRTVIGDKVFDYGAGECLIVATEVVAMGRISAATASKPYLGLNLNLDPVVLSSLLLDMTDVPEPSPSAGFGVTRADDALLDAWMRLAALLDRPAEIRVLAPRLEDELLFRLLMGAQGTLLRQIARSDSDVSRVRRAMAWIRDRYSEPLSVAAIADVAGMSVSTFHRRFKATTALSPLQYQKQLRLHEARRRLIAGKLEAASAGFSVGYESASQFSREYKRLFGLSPGRDTKRMQSIVSTNYD